MAGAAAALVGSGRRLRDGMGIWSMHFVGMLALPADPAAYDVGITLASIDRDLVSGFALLTVTRTP